MVLNEIYFFHSTSNAKQHSWHRVDISSRVARWFLFKPKIPITVDFGGYSNGRCWYILCPFGQFPAILHTLWPFGIFPKFWYIFTRFGMLYQEKSGNPDFQMQINFSSL
jgi:hypothetical protein